MTQAFFQSVRKFNFYNFKPKTINQNETVGTHYKQHILSEYGSILQPKCMDYNPDDDLFAVGNVKGCIKIFGRPGVHVWATEENNEQILTLKFIQGTTFLITVTVNNRLSLWSYYSQNNQSRDLIKIDSITTLSILCEEVTLNHYRPSAAYNNYINNDYVHDYQWITTAQVIDKTSSLILGDCEGTLIQVPLDIVSMKQYGSEKSRFNRNNSINKNKFWTVPAQQNVISRIRLLSKLPSCEQYRYENQDLGAVTHISSRPGCRTQILIGFRHGLSIVYDIQRDSLLCSFHMAQSEQLSHFETLLTWESPIPVPVDALFVSPRDDGKPKKWFTSDRLFSAHGDGSLKEWNIPEDRSNPIGFNCETYFPFGDQEKCLPITNLLIKKTPDLEDLFIFVGGLPASNFLEKSTVTVTTFDELSSPINCDSSKRVVFELTKTLVDMFTIDDRNGESIAQFLVIITEEELLVIDLTMEGWPVLQPSQQPYLTCMHQSSITALQFIANVPESWFEELDTSRLGKAADQNILSNWPIQGQLCQKLNRSSTSLVNEEMIWLNDLLITGHASGNIVFWRLGRGGCLKKLNTLNGGDAFFKIEAYTQNNYADDDDNTKEIAVRLTGVYDCYYDDLRFSIQLIQFSGSYLVAGGFAGQVMLWSFSGNSKMNSENSFKPPHLLEVDLITHLPNFKWRGCTRLDLVDFNDLPTNSAGEIVSSQADSKFQPLLVVSVYPPSQITSLDMKTVAIDTNNNNVKSFVMIAFGTLQGAVMAMCDSDGSHRNSSIVTSHCTIPANEIAQNEAALGDGWARRRTRDLKKTMRESFRKLRRRSTKRADNPAIKRNMSLNASKSKSGGDEPKSVVELVEQGPGFEERLVESRPKESGNAGLVLTVSISLKTNTIGKSTSHDNPNTVRHQRQSITLFAGTEGGQLLCFHNDSGLVANDTGVTTNSLRLVKQYQLQHRAPILYMTPLTNDGKTITVGGSKANSKFDQLLLISGEQLRIYSLNSWSLKHKFRFTAHEGFQIKNANIVSLVSDNNGGGRSENDEEQMICAMNSGGQLLVASTINLKKKDSIQLMDKSDFIPISTFTMPSNNLYNDTCVSQRSASQLPSYAVHHSGFGQITHLRIVPKSKQIN